MFDIETLRIIWWGLLGFLLVGFALTDGWDFGIAMLLPLVTRNEEERMMVLDVIGPFWEGNQVWIILGAGAMFAAWPFVYAVAFSGFYFLILLLLLTMGISRPVSFKYRSKLPNFFWRRFWDWTVFAAGGVTPALIFGLLMGNALQGVPFYFDDSLRIFYTGSFWELFNPFAWWCGFTSLAMLAMHGGLYLAIKTYSPIRDRALFWSRIAAIAVIILFGLGGVWIAKYVPGYFILNGADPAGFSNPLHKQVGTQVGMWLQNYSYFPLAFIAPACGLVGAALACLTARVGNSIIAFLCSGLSIAGIITTVGISMFPFLLPSSTHPGASLLVWDSSSSQLTLLIMLIAVAIFMPIILFYTSWVYRMLRGKVSVKTIAEDEKH